MTEPACAPGTGVEPAVFQADEPGYDPKLAKDTCAQCPVRGACLARVLDLEGGASAKGRTGIWAGTTPEERAQRVRARRPVQGGPPRAPNPNPNHLTPEQQQARRDAHAAGMSDYAMAEMFGVTPTTIRTWRMRHGLPTNNPDHSRYSALATEETRKAMWRAGATDAEIAAAVGISQTAVGKWRNHRRLRVNSARRVA